MTLGGRQSADLLARAHGRAHRGSVDDGFVRRPPPVWVRDSRHASTRERSPIADDAVSSRQNWLVGSPQQVYASVTCGPGLGWRFIPSHDVRLRSQRPPVSRGRGGDPCRSQQIEDC